MDTQKNSLADRLPEFGAFMREVETSVSAYHNHWRIRHTNPTRIGTSPLQELLLDGYKWLPGSVKIGLGETGSSNGSTSHGGPTGSHGADSLVVMMQKTSSPNSVPLYVGTLAYIHEIGNNVVAYGHFLVLSLGNHLSLEYRLPERELSGYSLIGMVYMPNNQPITPKKFVDKIKAYRGRRPLRKIINAPNPIAHLNENRSARPYSG